MTTNLSSIKSFNVLQKIFNDVLEYYNMTAMDMASKSRKQNIVEARQMFCFMARHNTFISLQEIAKYINRDHCTVLHGVSTVTKRIEVSQRRTIVALKYLKDRLDKTREEIMLADIDAQIAELQMKRANILALSNVVEN